MLVNIGKTKGVLLMKKQLILLTMMFISPVLAVEKDNLYSYQPSLSSSNMNVIESFQSGKMDEEIIQKKQDLIIFKNEIKNNIDKLIADLESNHQEIAKTHDWFNNLETLKNDLNPSQKMVLTNIRKKFKEYTELCLSINDNLVDLPQLIMESQIHEYFSDLFPNSIINVTNKKGGIQLGKIVNIETTDSSYKQYFVKTHQYGLQENTKISTVQSIDLKEPFVYKFLELCGISPEVHFFYDDSINFYIATKNDGYSQDESTEFVTYDKAIENENFYKSNKELVDESFILADFYTRILRLDDVFSQKGNIGFIKNKNKYNGFRIIDFRTLKDKATDYTLEGLYKGWEIGNNHFTCSNDKDLARDIILSIVFKSEKGSDYEIDKEKLFYKKGVLNKIIDESFYNYLLGNLDKTLSLITENVALPLKLDSVDLKIYNASVKNHVESMYENLKIN